MTYCIPPSSRRPAAAARLLRVFCILAAALPAIASADPAPANLGRGLRGVAGEFDTQRQAGKSETDSFHAALAASDHVQGDDRNRVLMDIVLDGSVSLDQVRQKCESLGGTVTAAVGSYRHGMFSAWLPLSEAAPMSAVPGVSAVHLAPKPRLRIGAATSQGVVVHKTDLVNNSGYLGAGITVGVLSDSYNNDRTDSTDPGWTTAKRDVATGDLPGTGNPDGDTTPVDVIEDGPFPATDTDEGRAMLQIVHDVAPAAHLAFCTSGDSDAEMAANIGQLETKAKCQVICDDSAFFDEPMFSDGVIAQAVDAAAADGVAYFSAIGNDANSGYQATFNPVDNPLGRTRATAGGVKLATIPRAETNVISQWHSFGVDSGGNPIVVQNIRTGLAPTTLVFQWDDPFDVVTAGQSGITTDYDILVFNSAGTYGPNLSGTEDNISANEPLELPARDMAPNTSYKICIVRTTRVNGTQAPQATHLRYLATDNEDTITGDDITLSNVAALGHACAAGCSGVAAYDYDDAPDPGNSSHVYTPLIEGYSSNGPVDIYFDSSGNRLSTPVTRKQPVFACADNVDTSFFPPFPTSPNPNDFENDGFPNFAGTSASAPHAAGIAALLMNAAAANQMGTLSPQQIKSILIATTQGSIDEDPVFCSGTAGPVTITNTGDDEILPNIFQITFNGATGQKLTGVTIDLSPDSMHFDNRPPNGLPFFVDSTTGRPIPTARARVFSGGSSGKSSVTIPFTNFEPGDTFSFSLGFDDDDTDSYGYDADELDGATISATVSGVASPYTGALGNQLARTYNYKAGYGLLDAQAALNMLLNP
jgi:hypothetical protein